MVILCLSDLFSLEFKYPTLNMCVKYIILHLKYVLLSSCHISFGSGQLDTTARIHTVLSSQPLATSFQSVQLSER